MEPTDPDQSPTPDASPNPVGATPPEPGPEHPRFSTRTWVATGVGALAIVAIAAFGVTQLTDSGSSASATNASSTGSGGQSGSGNSTARRGFGFGAFGTIESIDGTTLTVSSQMQGTVTVETDDDTKVVVSSDASLSDVKEGDHVTVASDATTSSGSDDSTVAATRIVDTGDEELATGLGRRGGQDGPPTGEMPQGGRFEGGPPSGEMPQGGFPSGQMPPGQSADGQSANGQVPPGGGGFGGFGRRVSGVVTAVDGSTLTVKTDDGSVTVTTSSATTVVSQRAGKVSDLAKGDSVVVRARGKASSGSSSTITARTIVEGEPGGPGGAFPGGGSGAFPGGPGGTNGNSNGGSGSSGGTTT